MEFEQARDRFIQIWGTVGVDWGINRTMAQVHALLLSSSEPLSTDEVMEVLKVSRGNANMNLRELVNWGLVYRERVIGDRKDFYVAEKDMWEVAQKIVAERKRRELDPMMKMLEQLIEETSGDKQGNGEMKRLCGLISEIHDLGKKSGNLLELVLRLDKSAFFKPLKTLFRRR